MFIVLVVFTMAVYHQLHRPRQKPRERAHFTPDMANIGHVSVFVANNPIGV